MRLRVNPSSFNFRHLQAALDRKKYTVHQRGNYD